MAEITLAKIRRLLDKTYPRIGNRAVSKITAQEVLLVLRSVEATGRYESARRMRRVLSRVFRYAIATARAERDPRAEERRVGTACVSTCSSRCSPYPQKQNPLENSRAHNHIIQ